MGVDEEEEQLRTTALKNAESILRARQRAERELALANEELLQQRQWFEVTLSSIGDAVITTDLQGRVTFLNPVAERMTGWSVESARGVPVERIFVIVNETTSDPVDSPIAQVLATGTIVGLANHTVLVSRNGTRVAIEDSAAPIRDLQGNVAGAVMVFHDVTLRRRAEGALRASEERFRATFDQALVGIGICNLDRSFADANSRFCEIIGHSAEELRKLTFLDITHPDDVAETQALVQRLLAGEIPYYALEKRYLRKSGEPVWSHTKVTLLKDAAGEPNQFIGVIEDITERRQAQELRALLAAVVESSDDAVVSKTLGGIITSWNQGAARTFGYRADEVIGKPITILIPADRIDEEEVILSRLRRGERIEHYETVRCRKDGTPLDVSITVSPIRGPGGTIIGASKIARDITQQKQVQRELREQARVLELLNSTGTAIAGQLELEALVQTVTDAATQLSGAQFGAFFYNVIDPRGESFLLYALSGAPRAAFDKFGLPRNTPVFNATFRGQGVVRSPDITRDPRYGKLEPHRGMPKGHLPVCSYLAVPVISRTGGVLGGLFFGHSQPNVFTEQSERLVVGVAAQAAVAIDNARLFEAAQHEIASRERIEAQLMETDRRKDEFLAILAHELRNPLAPIRQAALISKAPSATEAQKRWSHDVITRQVQHMSLLLDDLLDVSRITRGTLELRTEMTELAAIIDAAVETARPPIDAKRHRFSVDVPSEPLHFAADPLRLAQVLANLLTNAAKYTDPEGEIEIRATRERDEVVISVRDNGIGLTREETKSVFRMFSQVKASQDRSEGGLGIGLALAEGLVELHGGTLSAASEGPGKGSEFTVRLPIRSVSLPRARKESHETSPGRAVSLRILIADDNRDAAESLSMLLEMEGHHVQVVHDGRAALSAFTTFQPQVAVLDIGMPELNGYDVARAVRQGTLGRAVTLVAVTGWGQDSDKARALAAGFNHHFTKPIEPERLTELLRTVTSRNPR